MRQLDADPISMDNFDWKKEVEKTIFTYNVVGIYISPDKGIPMQKMTTVEVEEGKGVVGDRNHMDVLKGAFSTSKRIPVEDRMVSFISLQAVARANCILMAQNKEPYQLSQTRRAFVIDMPEEEMKALIGKTIRIGDVEFIITYPCDPCARPPTLMGRENDFEPAFQDRGGVRGRAKSSGEINLLSSKLIVVEAEDVS